MLPQFHPQGHPKQASHIRPDSASLPPTSQEAECSFQDPGAEEDCNEMRKYNLLRNNAFHDFPKKDQKHFLGIEHRAQRL